MCISVYSCVKMEGKDILICRICLETNKSGFEVLDQITKNSLSFLRLKLNLDINHEPLVCNTCIDSIKRCVDFKTDCLHKRGPTFTDQKNIVSESTIYLTETIKTETGIHCSCLFCMEFVDDEQLISLKDEKIMTESLEKYFPEFINGFDVGMNFMVCRPCYQTLQSYMAFISQSMAAEEKIMKYCQVEGMSIDEGGVDLSSVLYFTPKDYLQNHLSLGAAGPGDSYERENNQDELKIKIEAFMEVQDQEMMCIKNEEIKIETEENDADRVDGLQSGGVRSTQEVYECELCLYQGLTKRSLTRHMLTHKSLEEVTTYDCGVCQYQAKRKYDLQRHSLIHKSTLETEMYKCEKCVFKTKYKNSLRIHAMTHRSFSEVAVYRCDACTFQSKYKTCLHTHMLAHKSSSEKAQAYRCALCAYETKSKGNLRIHMVTHKSSSEVTVYKCEFDETCTYETKYKPNLRIHMVSHKSAAEITMYKCELGEACTFETKYKPNLRAHMMIHKNSSEVNMYKCEFGETCAYQTKRKSILRRHMMIHGNPSKVTMYKCTFGETCAFETKYKANLRIHMDTHTNCPMYKCNVFSEACAYRTKHKANLRKHIMTTHRNSSEVTMYKCEFGETCTFVTKHKGNLRTHMLTHKNSPEVRTYKCEFDETCAYETKRKNNLRRHMVTHKNR